MIVMEGEYHTLGAMVFSQQLRRAGASVRLIVGRREDEILDIVAQDQFDALVLSLSRVEVLASARKLVEKLRSATSLPAPVVVGGAVAEHETKLMKLTGADHVASDARDALFKCGLKTFQNGAKLRAIPR